MNVITAAGTDIGTRKNTNQDSVLILQAESNLGRIIFAAVCDGMGGLAKGEVASATMVKTLDHWFKVELPEMLDSGFTEDKLCDGWRKIVEETNRKLFEYGEGFHINLGTTAAVLLIIGNAYYIMNIGDSRVYLLTDNIYQLTKDQTFVQREIDEGRMTPEEAYYDSRRSVLLQCIGASRIISPDFLAGKLNDGQGAVFMLCSDGFRHVVSPQEIYDNLRPENLYDRAGATAIINNLIRTNISRGEDDNISAAVVRI